ncbi:MAG: hypothetical protein ACYC69_03010 [Thermodesulfovibrionales bacterium]
MNLSFRAFVKSICFLVIAAVLFPSVHGSFAHSSATPMKSPVDKERLRQDVQVLAAAMPPRNVRK